MVYSSGSSLAATESTRLEIEFLVVALCHIYLTETAKDKKDAEKEIEELNKLQEPIYKAEWELNTKLSHMGLCNQPGKVPK